MSVVQSFMERLRPLVGLKSWDYCVLWKLGEDQRSIEWMGCCCSGAENTQNGEQLLFPVSTVFPCRDVILQHPKTKACDLLAQFPSSIPLDLGIHAETLLSNQPRWLNLSNSSNSSSSDETVGTKVLIPVNGGLIELFVAKNVSEDQRIIDFIMAQCNVSRGCKSTGFDEQPPMLAGEIEDSAMADEFPADDNAPIDPQSKPFSTNGFFPMDSNNHPHSWVAPMTMENNQNLPWDLPVENIRLLGSVRQFCYDKPLGACGSSIENGFQEIFAVQQLLTSESNLHPPIPEYSVNMEVGRDRDSIKHESGQANSVSDCSDQIDEDDVQRVVGRSGRRPQSKNLFAERKRRKKLNDRLYSLRALVPKISKMDRASILRDAIEFVKELQKKVKDLQDELEEPPEEDGSKNTKDVDNHLKTLNQNGLNHGANDEQDESLKKSTLNMIDHGTRCSSNSRAINPSKQNRNSIIPNDKEQQMEVQVEVTQIDSNEFFLKVFCEHKPGGFVRLMEAMNSLGLEVTNANVTTFRGLVLNVFKVEKRDNEVVQADNVRDSLLDLTRNPNGGWSSEAVGASENGSVVDRHSRNHHMKL